MSSSNDHIDSLLEALLAKHLPNALSMRDLEETGIAGAHRGTPPETDRHRSLKIVETKSERVLLFIREIRDTLESYNNSITNQTFGPELIHQTDFTAIQLQLASFQLRPFLADECKSHRPENFENPQNPRFAESTATHARQQGSAPSNNQPQESIRKCVYLLKLRDGKTYHYVCTLMLDKYFLAWYRSEKRCF